MAPFSPAITLTPAAMLAPDVRANPPPSDREAAYYAQQVLQYDPPGQWGANRYRQTDHWTGMVTIAGKAYLDAVAAAKVSVWERKKGKTVKKSLGVGHYVTDENYEPADPDCAVCRVVEEPGGPDGAWEFSQELEFLTIQYLLTGDAPAWCPHNTRGQPTRFFALVSALTQPVFGAGQNATYPKGLYRYSPSSGRGTFMGSVVATQAYFPAEEVGRFRELDPWTRSAGRSRLESLSKEIDLVEAITDSRWAMFDHGLQLDTVVLMPGVDKEECEKLQKTIEQKSGGARNARRFRVLGGGGMGDKFDLKTFGQSAREMDYQSSYDQAAGVVLSGYRVPKSAAGLTSTQSYSALYAEKQQLREYGLLPYFFKLSRFTTQTLAKPWNEFPGQFKIEVEAPPLGDLEADERERQFAVQQGIITHNEYRKATGRDTDPDGDVPVSIRMAKLQQQVAPPPMPGMAPGGDPNAAPGEPGAESPPEGEEQATEGDPLASLLGGDEGQEDTPEAAQEGVTQAALAALGLGTEDDAPEMVQKAGVPVTKPGIGTARQKRNEGETWQVNGQWYTKKQGRTQAIADPSKAAQPKASARDLIAARLGKKGGWNVKPTPPPLPAGYHDETAKKFLNGRPSIKLLATGSGKAQVHEIKDGASLQKFIADGGKLPADVLASASEAVPSGPVAQKTYATANQWAAYHADKHADRVAAHFGISRERAHALLTHAITQIAAHAAKNGGKVGTLRITDKRSGKTARLSPVKSSTPTGGGPPRPANPDGEGSRPPMAKAMSAISDPDGGFLVAPAQAKKAKKRKRVAACVARVLQGLEQGV